jgi:hypothetical protein
MPLTPSPARCAVRTAHASRQAVKAKPGPQGLSSRRTRNICGRSPIEPRDRNCLRDEFLVDSPYAFGAGAHSHCSSVRNDWRRGRYAAFIPCGTGEAGGNCFSRVR